MTAKEKAIEIAKQYWLAMGSQNYPTAIKCAIIHVKGIIEELKALEDFNSESFATVVSKRMEYEEVLTELNQM